MGCPVLSGEDMRYCEFAAPSVMNRGMVKSLDSVQQYRPGQHEEAYRSYFELDEDGMHYLMQRGTLSGFTGWMGLSRVLFDVDRGNASASEVLERARTLVRKLQKSFTKEIQTWFSGTGYHIVIPELFGFREGPGLPSRVRITLEKFFPEYPETISLLYPTSLIRLPNSWNKKSQRRKVLVPIDRFFSDTAVNIDTFARGIYDDTEWMDARVDGTLAIEPHQEFRTRPPVNPTTDVTCMQHIWNEGPVQGSRSVTLLRLFSIWRRKGLDQEACLALAKLWLGKHFGEKQFTERWLRNQIERTFGTPYQFGCNDPILQSKCDSICRYFKRKDFMNDTLRVKTFKDLEQQYVSWLRADYGAAKVDLHEVFPGVKSFEIVPGEMVYIAGYTGLGKSAIVQNMAVAWKGRKILWMDYENGDNLIYRRFVQIDREMTKRAVNEHYMSSSNTYGTLDHIVLPVKPFGLTELREYVATHRPNIVVIDTDERMPHDAENDYRRIREIVFGLRDICTQHPVIMLVIHHLAKGAVYDFRTKEITPLTLDGLKGNSDVIQQADKVLALEHYKDNDNIRRFRSLKARDEEPFDINLIYDTNTFRFTHG
jgi:archaellum biogenesis ATPase FlaH